MNALIVFIVIVVLSAIIGAVSQVLKNQQQAEQARAARARAANRANGDDRREGRAASDIDRFLEEIDKLRRKSAAGGPAPPPSVAPVAKRVGGRPVVADVPTVEPARKPRVAGDPTFAAPVAPVVRAVPTSHPVAAPLPRLEDLPVAPVVGPSTAYSPSVVTRPKMLADPRPVKKTELAAQLAALLGTKNALPLAVVLQEVLGPPKCKRG